MLKEIINIKSSENPKEQDLRQKQEIQQMASDISYQLKTSIANLKMSRLESNRIVLKIRESSHFFYDIKGGIVYYFVCREEENRTGSALPGEAPVVP